MDGSATLRMAIERELGIHVAFRAGRFGILGALAVRGEVRWGCEGYIDMRRETCLTLLHF